MTKRIKELMAQAGIDVEAVENLGEMPTALKFAELIVKMCADAADMAYDARCKHPGDYVVEAMGCGEEGAANWRSK